MRMSVPSYWREMQKRYRLEGVKCENCGKILYPPKPRCGTCGSSNLTRYKLPEVGRVITYTVLHEAPSGFEYSLPYIIAVVELENGTRVLSQITDCPPDKVHVGMKVEAVFRRVTTDGDSGIILYGTKFRPILGQQPCQS